VKLSKEKEISRKDIIFSMARRRETGDGSSRRVIFGSSDGKLYDIDVAEEKPEPKPVDAHSSWVMGVAVAGDRLVSGSYDRELVWRDAASLEETGRRRAHDRWIRGVVASPDGKIVASVADDMVCRLWSSENGELRTELRGHREKTPNDFRSMLFACAFSADGSLLATADKVGHVVIWDVEKGKEIASVESPGMYTWDPRARIHSIGGARSVAFSPDGRHLAVGGIGKIGNVDHLGGKARIELFDWIKGESLGVYEDDKFKGLVEHLEFEPTKGRWLLAGGGDHNGFVSVIDPQTRKPLLQQKAPMHVHELDIEVVEDNAEDEANDVRVYGVGHGRVAVWRLHSNVEA